MRRGGGSFSNVVHIDLLTSMDSYSFLMAPRYTKRKTFKKFIRPGKKIERGGIELRDGFTALQPELQAQLASQQIRFVFNPPNAPHFGGCWEREI